MQGVKELTRFALTGKNASHCYQFGCLHHPCTKGLSANHMGQVKHYFMSSVKESRPTTDHDTIHFLNLSNKEELEA